MERKFSMYFKYYGYDIFYNSTLYFSLYVKYYVIQTLPNLKYVGVTYLF